MRNKKEKLIKICLIIIYMDESGKTDNYFVLAGILLNGKKDNESQKLRFNELKKKLNSKYNLRIEELKFTDIKKGNLSFYKDYVNAIFEESVPMVFLSIIAENRGLKQKTKKEKTKDLLEIFLKELTSIIVRGTCGSAYASDKAKLNVTLDKDGIGYDAIERERIKQKLDVELKQQYKYLIALEDFTDIDSKDNIFVQFAADLYAGSLNNLFAGAKVETETAKCKKEFAQHLLNYIGITGVKDSFPAKNKNEIGARFISKFIPADK